MWTENCDGAVIWSDPAKLVLLSYIKNNQIVLSQRRCDQVKKAKAWQNIYSSLVEDGMPETSTARIQRAWFRLRDSTLKIWNENKKKMKYSRGKQESYTKSQKMAIDILGLKKTLDDEMPRVSLTR